MSSSTSPTVAEILAALGATTFAGDIIIKGASTLSTSVGVAAEIQPLVILDTGASSLTTASVVFQSQANPLIVGSGVEGTATTSADGLSLTFSGTVDQINADLGLLSYSSQSAGHDTITMTFTDVATNTGSASFGVDVLATSGAPGGASTGAYVMPTDIGQDATLSGDNRIYTASSGIDVVVASGTASTVTGGASGSSLTLVQTGGSYQFANQGGSALIVANSAAGTIAGGMAGSTVVAFLDDQATTYVGGSGDDMIIAGSGRASVTGGEGGTLTVFGGSGTLDFQGGSGSETVVGGTGAETIHAAASGGAYFGGSGGSQMFAAGAGSFLIGAVDGDVMTSSALGGDGLVAGAGNETLNGGGSRWENVLFGGSGHDTVMLGAGNDTYVGGTGSADIEMGSGSAALFAGTGAEMFDFDGSRTDATSGSGTPGSDLIDGFRVGTDRLSLSGGLTVSSYASDGGGTSLQLSDGTRIHLATVTGVTQASLFG